MNRALSVRRNLQIISIRMTLVVMITAALTIVLFEVIPERSVWSIPEGIQEVDEHIITVPAYSVGLSLLRMQEQGEDSTKELDYKEQYNYRRRILIVDDEPDITIAFEKSLRDKGFEQVETANDPLLCSKDFKAGLYDLLIIDITMPQMDGFDLYEKIRKDNKVKVCFITAFEVNYQAMRDIFPATAATATTDDMGCFIRKPVDAGELIKHIEAELRYAI